MLRCVVVCCSGLQCVVVRPALEMPFLFRHSMSQCVAVCCIVLQCVAVCSGALQCVAVRCSTSCTIMNPKWIRNLLLLSYFVPIWD